MKPELYAWFKRWGLSPQAIQEYKTLTGVNTDHLNSEKLESEAGVQQAVRLEASKNGSRLWRNNSGVAVDNKGNFVRYGLCNESKRINQSIKSADLIGVTPYTVTPDMVGFSVGIFTAVECKKPGWKYTGTPHEIAQLAFLELVNSMGGIGKFMNGVE